MNLSHVESTIDEALGFDACVFVPQQSGMAQGGCTHHWACVFAYNIWTYHPDGGYSPLSCSWSLGDCTYPSEASVRRRVYGHWPLVGEYSPPATRNGQGGYVSTGTGLWRVGTVPQQPGTAKGAVRITGLVSVLEKPNGISPMVCTVLLANPGCGRTVPIRQRPVSVDASTDTSQKHHEIQVTRD
ncbi:hypothetical protein PCASD_09062 [Puccinia coronata f. sp. avenae]|uniref:Uncharacterized protein n=1 Tax=Puccinia coronata f. sp. avenae TaxID=200324 RepID=A0A2N5UIP5_9BASI|nr:hypothetical protein PCASD_09062 [Puccinia coronata f. sp. avenae]